MRTNSNAVYVWLYESTECNLVLTNGNGRQSLDFPGVFDGPSVEAWNDDVIDPTCQASFGEQMVMVCRINKNKAVWFFADDCKGLEGKEHFDLLVTSPIQHLKNQLWPR